MATAGLRVDDIIFIFPTTWVSDDEETKKRKRKIWDETNELYLQMRRKQREVSNEKIRETSSARCEESC